MVTDPVRAVYSVSLDSGIQIGYSEVLGGGPFNGATAENFENPYADVNSGSDLGFVADTKQHDAGIMMQWTLPSAPGTYDRALKFLVGDQGASLSAVPRSLEAVTGKPVLLDLAILNTGFDTETGLGYSYQLPTGIVVGDGSVENSCGGVLTAVSGSSGIQLSGVEVLRAENCVTSIPVVALSAGTIEFNRDAAGPLEGSLHNGIGAYTLTATGQPVEPEDPVDPVEPEDPVDPVEPEDPVDPVEPGEPSGPVEPGEPSGPVEPSEPAKPVEPSGPAKPVEPEEPNGPAKPVEPVGRGMCPALYGWEVIGDQVGQLYQSLLGRVADAGGLVYWTQARLSGMPARELAALILDSPEGRAVHRFHSNADFVDRLYANGLGRKADSGGREYWIGQLGAGMDRADLAVFFSDLALVEVQGDPGGLMTDHQALVCRLYRTLFDRSPDDSGFAYWASSLDAGLAPTVVAEAMLATAEAGSLGQANDQEFVDHLYRRSALQQSADQSARQHWTLRVQAKGRAWTLIEIANLMEQ